MNSPSLNNVATLIVKPEADRLTDADLGTAARKLTNIGAETGTALWLSSGEAADIPFSGKAPEDAHPALAVLFKDRPVDIACQPEAGRRKGLLVADMDSTIIENECIDEIADMLGLKDRVAPITEAAMRGEIEFEQALRDRVALLAGLSTGQIEEIMRDRIRITDGARKLVATMKANGARTVLISGGFTFFAERVGAAVGFDQSIANHLLWDGDALTGTLEDPIIGAATKRETLVRVRDELGLAAEAVLAVGDGANDIPMLQEAGLGIAYHAKPATALAADASISHTDLTALLFIQGYRRDQFRG